MFLPCEVAVKTVIPAIRSAIVRVMYNELGFKQVDIAGLLNITQAAVSQYIRGARGTIVNVDDIPELHNEVLSFINEVVSGKTNRDKQIIHYCKLCNIIRAKGLMCNIHKQYDLTVRGCDCSLCKFFKCGFQHNTNK